MSEIDILEGLLEAWKINNEIDLFILDWVPEEGLQAVTLLKTGKPSKGRNVARIFAHMHEVRCSRLEHHGADAGELPRFEGSEVPARERLQEALTLSGQRVAELMRAVAEGTHALKSWKRSPVTWLVYLISHDAHHRGQIAQALKQSGVRPPDEVSYSVWGYWAGYALKPPK